jgi:hypothetical protein
MELYNGTISLSIFYTGEANKAQGIVGEIYHPMYNPKG